MSNWEILNLYDTRLDLTLADLARISGRSIEELKRLLLKPAPVQHARQRGRSYQLTGK